MRIKVNALRPFYIGRRVDKSRVSSIFFHFFFLGADNWYETAE